MFVLSLLCLRLISDIQNSLEYLWIQFKIRGIRFGPLIHELIVNVKN